MRSTDEVELRGVAARPRHRCATADQNSRALAVLLFTPAVSGAEVLARREGGAWLLTPAVVWAVGDDSS